MRVPSLPIQSNPSAPPFSGMPLPSFPPPLPAGWSEHKGECLVAR